MITTPEIITPFITSTYSSTPEIPEDLVFSFETPLPSPTPFEYEVQVGDTMSEIAEKFGVSLDALFLANPDVSPNSMSVGTKINIPSNPSDPVGVSTVTPVFVPVKQIECYPTTDKGMWCFALVYNDSTDMLENLSAQVTLIDDDGRTFISAQAFSLLNILPPGTSLPLMIFFPPNTLAKAQPRVQMLSGHRLLPDDPRYLPVILQNTLSEVKASGRSAQVSGTVRLPDDVPPASLVWVVAVAYDKNGRVVGARRWESSAKIPPGGNVHFSFVVSSLAGTIDLVEFVAEARP